MENHPDLTPEQWQSLLGRLMRRALIKVAAGYWHRARAKKSWVEQQAEDFVMQAVGSVISGERVWNRDAYPSFDKFLEGVVDSQIWAAKTKAENTTLNEPLELTSPDGDAVPREPIVALWAPATDFDGRLQNDKMKKKLLTAVGDDKQLQELVEGCFAGFETRAEFAELLGLSPEYYDAVRKRFERRLRDAGLTAAELFELRD